MHEAGKGECNPVCKLTDNTGGDESQSIAQSSKRKVTFIEQHGVENKTGKGMFCTY